MTYRLMAEMATDLVCKKLNVTAQCTTAIENLPGSRKSLKEIDQEIISLPALQRRSVIYRHGDLAGRFIGNTEDDKSLVCECEEVSVGEVKYALKELDVNGLVDLRRRIRVGMGTCQGELCACRAAGLMEESKIMCSDKAKEDLVQFLDERWKGIFPVAWGDTLRESEYTSWVYESICGIDKEASPQPPPLEGE